MTPSDHPEELEHPTVEPATPRPDDDDTILITDLAPRREVTGGSVKLRFGQDPTDESSRIR